MMYTEIASHCVQSHNMHVKFIDFITIIYKLFINYYSNTRDLVFLLLYYI